MPAGCGWLPARLVHPHSRGENAPILTAMEAYEGSSPLARGKSSDLYNLDLGTRFIPTRAGKIVSRLLTATLTWVHPHSRGENQSWRTIPTTASGSSPLARGKLASLVRRAGHKRFIPTRAGKMVLSRPPTGGLRVHPHSRGENLANLPPESAAAGSSPLARGKCALIVFGFADDGSSPLARGKCAAAAAVVGQLGFIPTRAGKIVPGCAAPPQVPVHPHSRGENSLIASPLPSKDGSSPLARGKSTPNPHRRRRPRFIPTRAGKMVVPRVGG